MKEYEGSNADSSCVSVYACTCAMKEYERSSADRSCVSLYVHVYIMQ